MCQNSVWLEAALGVVAPFFLLDEASQHLLWSLRVQRFMQSGASVDVGALYVKAWGRMQLGAPDRFAASKSS